MAEPSDNRPWIERHLGKLVIGMLAVGVVLSLLHGAAEAFLSENAPRKAPRGTFGREGQPTLHGRIALDRSLVRSGEPVEIVLRFENRTTEKLLVSFAGIRAPGFAPAKTDRAKGPFRIRAPAKLAGRRLVGAKFDLPPNQRIELSVPIQSDESYGTFELSVDGWWSKGSGAAVPWLLTLPDVQVRSQWKVFWAHAVRAFIALLGILALPTLLALGGAWFQQRQQTLANQRQAWANMLPVSHQNNTQLYIPLLSGVMSIEYEIGQCLDRIQDLDRESLSKALFDMLYSARRRRMIIDEGSGYYLKSREGEVVVATTLDEFLIEGLRENLAPAKRLEGLVDRIDPTESYSSYLRKIADSAATKPGESLGSVIRNLEDKLRGWLQNGPMWWFHLLTVGRIVLDFEVNRIYQFWYQEEPEFPVKDLSKALGNLRRSWPDREGDERWARVRDAITQYDQRLSVDKLIQPRSLAALVVAPPAVAEGG